MIYFCVVFIPPLYFILRGKWFQFIVNLCFWGLAWLLLISIIGAVFSPIPYMIAVAHASFNLRYEMMDRQAQMIANRMVEKMGYPPAGGGVLAPAPTPAPALRTPALPVSAPEPIQIHIHRDGQNYGPYSGTDLRSYLASGSILPTDLAWYEGSAGWVPLAQLSPEVLR